MAVSKLEIYKTQLVHEIAIQYRRFTHIFEVELFNKSSALTTTADISTSSNCVPSSVRPQRGVRKCGVSSTQPFSALNSLTD